MTDLMELASRVAAGEGPDRELDARIWCALRGVQYKGHYLAFGSDLTQVEFTQPPKRKREVSLGRAHLPHALLYTASLDAAMTLVPGNWPEISISTDAGGKWRADLGMETENGVYDNEIQVATAFAAIPALALTAACLRARAHQGAAHADQ